MKTLLVGYKAQDLFEVGRRGERRPASWLDGDITCHTLDIYHCHAIENSSCGVKAVCSPHLPKEDWDLIKFKTGPKLMSGELSLDLLQEIHLLHPKRFELEFDGRERDRNDQGRSESCARLFRRLARERPRRAKTHAHEFPRLLLPSPRRRRRSCSCGSRRPRTLRLQTIQLFNSSTFQHP